MPKDNTMTSRQVAALLAPEAVSLDLQGREKGAALREVAGRLRGNPAVPDLEGFFAEILAREATGSTAMGHGVAVPHARTDRCRDIVMAAGRHSEGLAYGAPDGQPIRLIFLIGTPRQRVTEYLRVVGALVRILGREDVRQSLLAATDAAAFIEAIASADGPSALL